MSWKKNSLKREEMEERERTKMKKKEEDESTLTKVVLAITQGQYIHEVVGRSTPLGA